MSTNGALIKACALQILKSYPETVINKYLGGKMIKTMFVVKISFASLSVIF
jgi:hypothetical protein